MTNIFTNLFNKSKTPDVLEESQTDNIVTFSIATNSDVTLKMIINDDSTRASNTLALFLYMLNSGLYAKQMVETIVSMSKDKDDNKFIENIIDSWSSYIELSSTKSHSKPIIPPSSFSKNNKNYP